MIYLENHKNNRKPKIGVIVVVILIITIFLIQIFIPHLFQGIFISLFSPFWRTEFSIENGSLLSPQNLLNENESLKRELSADLIRMESIKYIEFENAELRKEIGEATSTEKILAAVLKRPPIALYDELIIDAGKDKEIASSSIVFVENNIPIGQIVEVFNKTSKVILFSSPGQKSDVLIGQKHFPAVAVGRGGGQYEADLPKGLDVKEGDFVSSASFDSWPMGTISFVDSDSAEPFQKILFSVPVNIYQLKWVSVDTEKRE